MTDSLIDRYRDRLPIPSDATPITLLEGGTPLVPAPRLAHDIGYDGQLFLKLEGLNPTGSFKDRGMTVAMTAAAHSGAKAVACASTGNTSASAAAYAARAGVPCLVVIPAGNVAASKLSQTVMHGAIVAQIDDNFDAALDLVRRLAESAEVTLVNSVNPFRIEGQKTAAFEVCDTLGRAPDYHALPVGNAGNITAYWKGYSESGHAPVMLGYQAAGAAPLVQGAPIPNPDTVATAIRIGNPASWDGAVAVRNESGGRIESVTDQQILDAYHLIARTEGVFAEPASAAAVAGLKQSVAQGHIRTDTVTVCTLTGHGLKDPTTATDVGTTPRSVPADLNALRDLLAL